MKKTIKYGLVICILLFLIVIYSFVDKKYPIYDVEIPTEEYVLSEEISGGAEYSQTFVNAGESLKEVNVKCTVNDGTSVGKLKYVVYDENGVEIQNGEKEISDLKTAKFNSFSFDTIEDCEGETFTFKLWGEDTEGSGICVYKTVLTEPGTRLEENNSETEGTLVLKTVTHKFDWETFVVVLCFFGYIVIFIRMLYKFFR